VGFFLDVTFNSRFFNEICEKYSYIHHYTHNYRFAINKYFVVPTFHSTFFGEDDPFCCTSLTQFLTKLEAIKQGAFIRFNAHFLSDATKV
jgi:hypothetical protein